MLVSTQFMSCIFSLYVFSPRGKAIAYKPMQVGHDLLEYQPYHFCVCVLRHSCILCTSSTPKVKCRCDWRTFSLVLANPFRVHLDWLSCHTFQDYNKTHSVPVWKQNTTDTVENNATDLRLFFPQPNNFRNDR